MGENPGDRDKPPNLMKSPPPLSQHNPDQKAATKAWAMGGAPGGTSNMRTFSQIIEEEKSNRNILEIHITKTSSKPKNLTFDDIGDFISEIIKINPDVICRETSN